MPKPNLLNSIPSADDSSRALHWEGPVTTGHQVEAGPQAFAITAEGIAPERGLTHLEAGSTANPNTVQLR
jgi:hypothetical protein